MSELPCPLLATLTLAARFLETNASEHQQLEEARARIRREMEIAEAVHAELPCTPVINEAGLLNCPLAQIGGDVWALAFGRGDTSSQAVPLLADDVSIGAML
jgi:hypothetical protein